MEQTNTLKPKIDNLKTKSKVFPPSSINKNAHLFLKMVTEEITNLPQISLQSNNLSHKQRQALMNLSTYGHLTIKETDNEGYVVVMNSDHYKEICRDILKNTVWYREMSFEVLDSFALEYYNLIDEAYSNGVINKTIWQYIRTPSPRISTFYCLPKIHKQSPSLTG